MFTTYLSDVKESAFRGVSTLFKKSIKYHALVYLGFFILALIATLLTVGTSFIQPTQPAEMNEKILSNLENIGAIFFLMVPIAMLFGSWLYTLALSINDTVVRNESGDIMGAIKNSFTGVTIQMFLYLLLYIGIYIIGAIAAVLVIGLFSIISKLLAGIITVVAILALMIFLLRFVAGPAFIVHGKMGAIEALKASFHAITWVRAIILFVIIIGIIIVFYIVLFALLMMIGLNLFNPETSTEVLSDPFGSEFGVKMILYQIFNFIFGTVMYTFGYAAVSSFYFRYAQADGTSEDEQVAEHLVTE